MFDKFNREITYLRISVTDRCNLRCTYCMPECGVEAMSHDKVIRFEEIVEVVKAAVSIGISKFRITGGEPLVRKGIVSLVKMINEIPGVKELVMTTNGILLEKYAEELAAAGMGRVNVSLDTIDPEEYRKITRVGSLDQVFKGLQAAEKHGLTPIKLNCVIQHSSDEKHAQGVREFAREKGYAVQFIRQMNLEAGEFSVVEGGHGGDCPNCNRLRLTADGLIHPCLFSDKGYDVRKLGPEEALIQAIENKPETGSCNVSGKFYNIGG
ncbi:MAG: radical SAM protein [Marinilabiliales bacterium]|nr:MAG: radical SAM protein [Marinilabiliales bacterium]